MRMVQLLLQHGARIDLADERGRMAIDCSMTQEKLPKGALELLMARHEEAKLDSRTYTAGFDHEGFEAARAAREREACEQRIAREAMRRAVANGARGGGAPSALGGGATGPTEGGAHHGSSEPDRSRTRQPARSHRRPWAVCSRCRVCRERARVALTDRLALHAWVLAAVAQALLAAASTAERCCGGRNTVLISRKLPWSAALARPMDL